MDPLDPTVPTDDNEPVDLDAAYAAEDVRRISLAGRQSMADQSGLTLAEIDAFLADMGQAWAERDAEDLL